ncbi:MAG TPA: hypothetical protein VD866_20875, partial [Urbifossiella sp.]|nr:hypothetical protein [Urbifossiella sp.]
MAEFVKSITVSNGRVTGVTTGNPASADMAVTGVTPGSYTTADITVDAAGRITAAASGAGGPSLPVSLADGGTGASLTDPGADRIFFWDASAGATAFLTAGSGLSIAGTTLTATGSGGTVTSVDGASSAAGFTLTGAITGAGTLTFNVSNAATARATLGLGTAAVLDSDTDTTLAADSDLKVATQKAVKAYVDAAVVGLLDFRGSIACALNPNYPAALKGDAYYVSSAGKVGGASGKSVDIGDVVVASADNSGGTEASVGTSWFVLEHNLTGALLAANNLSDIPNPGTARSNLGLGTMATQSVQFTGGGTIVSNGATLTLGGTAQIVGTNTGDQTITLTGNVTGSGTGSFATTIAAGAVTNAMLAGSIDLAAKVTGVLPSANGGTGVDNGGRTLTVAANSGTVSFSSSVTLTVAAAASVSGTNTGDQTTITGNAGSATVLQTSRNFSIGGSGITAAAVGFNGSAAVVLAASVDADHITNARLRDSSAFSVIGRSANSTGDPADIAAANDGEVLRRSGTALGFGAVNLASAAAVTGVLPTANMTAASDTAAGAIEIATAAEIETGTDVVRA